MPLETGNQDNCQLITQWAKEQKIIPLPFKVARVMVEITTLQEIYKKLAVKKIMILSTKRFKCFAMGLAAHFNQFLAIWSEYGLVRMNYKQ